MKVSQPETAYDELPAMATCGQESNTRRPARAAKVLGAIAVAGALAAAGVAVAFAVSDDGWAGVAQTETTITGPTTGTTGGQATEGGIAGTEDRAGWWILIGITFWLLIFATLAADVFAAYWWRNKLLKAVMTEDRPDLARLQPALRQPLWGILHLARSLLAFAVVGFLGLVLLYVLVERPTNQPGEIIENLITLIGTLTTAVVAFYFGVRAADQTTTAPTTAAPPRDSTPQDGAPPSNTGPPTIQGVASVGQNLSATNGTWSGEPTYTHRWEREVDGDWLAIAGATDPLYVIGADDVGRRLRVTVTATARSGARAEKSSAPTEPVGAAGGGNEGGENGGGGGDDQPVP